MPRKKAEQEREERFRKLGEALQLVLDQLGPPASGPRRRARTAARPEHTARSRKVCDACGRSFWELCPDCGCCWSCCECNVEDEELFDADELGLDPEDDDQRKYGDDDA